MSPVQIDQFIIFSCKHSIIFITYFRARHLSNASSNALLSAIKLVYFIVVPFFFVSPTLVRQSHRNYLYLGLLVCILHYVSFLNNPIFIHISSYFHRYPQLIHRPHLCLTLSSRHHPSYVVDVSASSAF